MPTAMKAVSTSADDVPPGMPKVKWDMCPPSFALLQPSDAMTPPRRLCRNFPVLFRLHCVGVAN
jgi:hypothetical protein